MASLNPFEAKAASDAYKGADKVYRQSAIEATNFIKPKSSDYVLDIGAGTGISSEVILGFEPANLSLLEPSEAMLEKAKARLGKKASYVNDLAENIAAVCEQKLDLIYALNCFHLFSDPFAVVKGIAESLNDGASFVFNLSKPLLIPEEETEAEQKNILANLSFYQTLNMLTNNQHPIIAATIELLKDNLAVAYSRQKVQDLFASAGMELRGYKEVVISMDKADQQSIWRIIASSYLTEEDKIELAVKSAPLPESLFTRQALYQLVK